MRKSTYFFSLCLVAAVASGQTRPSRTENIQRSFPAPKIVGVANINGSVHVIGYSGQQVEMTAVKTIEADTQELVERGVREVVLKTEEKDGMLQIYPDGPFRDSHSPFEHERWENPGYHFNFEITVRVPQSMDIDLRNVNKGGITVEGVHGHFKVHEVNGPVDMKDVSGDGEAATVNGSVHVNFTRNPSGPCKFRTINGAVVVTMQPGLSADLEYKTMHGGIYTDYDLTGSMTPVGTAVEKNGRFVYRSHGFSRSRAGSGGPQLTFETLNGDIRILKQ